MLSEIKRLVDRNHRRHRLVLSGSANLLLVEQVSETLAGRAVFLTLDTITAGESLCQSPTNFLSDLFRSRLPKESTVGKFGLALAETMIGGMIPPVLNFEERSSVLRWW